MSNAVEKQDFLIYPMFTSFYDYFIILSNTPPATINKMQIPAKM